MSRRLLGTYLVLALAVLAALEIPLGLSYERSQRRELVSRIEHDALAMASIAEEALERGSGRVPAGVEHVARRYTEEVGGRIVAVDGRGRSVLDTAASSPVRRDFSSRPEIAAALGGRTVSGQRHSRTLDTDLIYVAVPVGSGGQVRGAVRVTYPASALNDRVLRYWLLLAAIAGVVLAAVTVVGVRLSRTLTGPLSQLEQAAAAASEGDLSARAPTLLGPPEIQTLSRQFNEMVERLQALLRSQQEFVADASHQLRTPLTALQLRLENLRHELAPGRRADAEAALGEVRRLTLLVEGLLALARADAAEPRAQPTDLTETVRRRLAIWAPQAESAGVALLSEVPAGLRAMATPSALEQVLDNLLENAITASAPGQTVTVAGERSGGSAILRIVDEGPGLSAEERARAFDRFWRGDGSQRGSGLGLPIAKRLVEADGGALELHEAATGGLEAVIRLAAA